MLKKWITFSGAGKNMRCAFYARKKFLLNELPASDIVLRISADSNYVLYCNNQYIGRGPVRGSISLQCFEEYSISQYLRCGENELFVEVYSLGEQNFVCHSLYPALALEIPGILQSDNSWQVQMAAKYRMDVPHYTFQSGYMEFADLREGIKPDSWHPAQEVDYWQISGKKPLKNTLPEFSCKEYFPAKYLKLYSITHDLPENISSIPDHLAEEAHMPLQNGSISGLEGLFTPGKVCTLHPGSHGIGMILDFGREVSGRVELQVEAPAGTTLEIAYGEAVTQDRIATKFDSDYHFTDCFILNDGVNKVTTNFAERGFRMIQLSFRNFDRPLKIHRIKGIDCRYNFVPRGTFFSSDYKLNRIFSVCQETLSACSSDVFMDPWRERAFWVNDLLVNNLATLHCFGAAELHRHALELTFSQPDENGLLYTVVPQPGISDDCDFIFAATNLYMVLILQDYWNFSGDNETVLKYLPATGRILDAVWQLADEQGILKTSGITAKWNFYDWSFEENHYCCNGTAESMLSSLFIIAAKTFIRMADALHYQFDLDNLQKRWQLTAENFEKRFRSPLTGLIEDEVLDLEHDNCPIKISTQLGHVFWLLTGEASADMQQVCIKAMEGEKLLIPDYYLHYFYFAAASISGHGNECLRRIRHYWGRCIDTGSPTLYEAGIHTFGTQSMNGSGSLCHGFGTIPVAFVHETILGVKASKPGFAEFTFNPQLLDLTFAQGDIPTPYGSISVELTADYCTLTVPENCIATLFSGRQLAPGKHQIQWSETK